MSLLDVDSDPSWAAEAWSKKSGGLDLKHLFKSENRGLTGAALCVLAVTGILLPVVVSAASDGEWIGAGLLAVGSAFCCYNGLLILDELNCRISEDHECRLCREETERWKANGEVSG